MMKTSHGYYLKNDMEEFDIVMFSCASIIANLANIFEIVMPDASKKLADFLGIKLEGFHKIILKEDITPQNVTPLFERIK